MLAPNDILKRKLQINGFMQNICLCGSSYKNVFFSLSQSEKMIALNKNYWNNCTVAHITLKLY